MGALFSNPNFQTSQDPSPSHPYLFLPPVQEHQQQLPGGPLPWASGVQEVEASALSGSLKTDLCASIVFQGRAGSREGAGAFDKIAGKTGREIPQVH